MKKQLKYILQTQYDQPLENLALPPARVKYQNIEVQMHLVERFNRSGSKLVFLKTLIG